MKKAALFSNKGSYRFSLMSAVLIITVTCLTSNAQNFSGLEGKTLARADDIASGLISLIGSGGLEGKINSVTVTSDAERALKLKIEYTGFGMAYLHALVLSSTKAVQNEVSEAGLDLTGKTSPADLELDLRDNVAEGFRLESAFLQIRISKNKTAAGGLLFLFAMDKTWQKEIRNENLMLQARLDPVGETAQLREGNKVIIKPVEKSVLVHQMNIPATTVTRTTATQTNERPSTAAARMQQMPLGTVRATVAQKPADQAPGGTAGDNKPVAMNLGTVDMKLVRSGLALSKSERDSGALGPDNNTIPLFEDLTITKDFEFPDEITNISMDIYPDKNPRTGIYYYLPAAYHLRWTADEGYAFHILYGTASPESSGAVRMSATLSPDISKKEIDLIKRLLMSYVSRNSGMKFNKLRLIPIRENPAVSFPGDLNNLYEITADKVTVNITSSLREPFQVSWVTDNTTKDEMQVSLLEKTGILGIVSLKPQSDNIPDIKLPVAITLADSRTLGRIALENKKWRTTPWKNETPYPLKLKYIHMLVVKDEINKAIPIIYSWKINDVVVPSTASVQFDASNVPSWVDDPDMAQRIWIEYSVADCDECDKAIINTITGGTYGTNTRKVTFETFQLFDSLDAQFIQIRVRSLQGDPKGEKVVEFNPVRIYHDNEIAESGQLYVPLETELSFDYFITVVMKNGNSYKSQDWIRSNEQEIYLGLDAIKKAIPGIPVKSVQ